MTITRGQMSGMNERTQHNFEYLRLLFHFMVLPHNWLKTICPNSSAFLFLIPHRSTIRNIFLMQLAAFCQQCHFNKGKYNTILIYHRAIGWHCNASSELGMLILFFCKSDFGFTGLHRNLKFQAQLNLVTYDL